MNHSTCSSNSTASQPSQTPVKEIELMSTNQDEEDNEENEENYNENSTVVEINPQEIISIIERVSDCIDANNEIMVSLISFIRSLSQ